MEEKLVSVIVPTYNVAEYIGICLDSLTKQTYTNIEVIVIDDGSSDDTNIICDEYASNYPYIKVIHIGHKGVSVARNIGIRNSRGEYITFVDSDDFVTCDFVQSLMKGIIENEADLAIVSEIEVSQNVKSFEYNNINELSFKDIGKKEIAMSILTNDEISCGLCNKMFNKQLFSNIEFPNGKVLEDVATFYKLAENSNKIVIAKYVCYFYRIRKGSITHSISFNIYKDKIKIEKERFYFYESRYPGLLENYLHYYIAILECYPFISRDLKKEVKSDFKKIYPKIKKYMSNKDKIKRLVYNLA